VWFASISNKPGKFSDAPPEARAQLDVDLFKEAAWRVLAC